MFDYGMGWHSSRASRFDQLDRDGTIDEFEKASLDGDQRTLDRLIDQLRREVSFERGSEGRRLGRAERMLDQLGRTARRGRSGLNDEDNDLIQRLRSALLAGANGHDDLTSAIGDPEELARMGRELANRLRHRGMHGQAAAVSQAVRQLEGQMRANDLGRLADDFEDASANGDGRAMDEMMDSLAGRIGRGEGHRGRSLSRTERGLDRLGRMARQFGYDEDNDTIQRLRSGVLAAMNGQDRLRTTLGDMPLDELIERGQRLADRLHDHGYESGADDVERALRVLENQRDHEGCCGPHEDDESVSHCARPRPGGWNDPRGMERDGDRIVTRGGYEIEAEGDSNWSIWDPNGDMIARISGDPHVTEGDGTRWDFSKDSIFRLPDGTQIFADTDHGSGRGRAATTRRLVIDDGSDRVTIDGVDGRHPQIGEIGASERDGFESAHGDDGEDLDVFSLVSEGDRIQFELLRSLGIVDGSSVGEDGYEPTASARA